MAFTGPKARKALAPGAGHAMRAASRTAPRRPGRSARPHERRATDAGDGGQVQVLVRDNNVDQALKALKKKMQREGIFREMKLRKHFEKPSERRAREAAEAVRRARKMERKRLEREGF